MDAKFPSVDPGQDQQVHTSRARSTKGIARLEEHQLEEGDHGNKEGPWQENWGVACKCVAGVEKVAGMPDEDWEPAQNKERNEAVAVERLIQISAETHRMEAETVLDQLDLGSVTPFLIKKDTPGQEDHPEKERYKGILKRGNGSTGGSSKPIWVKF